MLNVPESVKALFKQDGIRKNFRVQFPGGELPDITNDNVVQESVRFTESLCSQDVLKFGLTEASVLEFETVGVGNMYGMTIEAGIEIDLSSLSAAELAEIEAGSWDGVYVSESDTDLGFPFFRVPYGVFTVDKCPRNHEAMAHRQVTAYSVTYSDLAAVIPGFPTMLPVQSISVKPDAILSQVTRDGLTSINRSARSRPRSPLYTSAGIGYYFVQSIGTEYAYGAIGYADYIETTMDWDETAWRAVGNDIADQLTALGYDLTYNAAGEKVFFDNREAVEYSMPDFFGPAVVLPLTNNSINYSGYWHHIKPGALYPLLNGGSHAAAFFLDGTSATNTPTFCYFYAPSATPTVQLRLVSNDSLVETITIGVAVPSLPSNPGVSMWIYPYESSTNDIRLTIQAKGVAKNLTVQGGQTIPFYSFIDAYDKTAIVASAAEIRAYFGKAERDGSFQFEHLDLSDPVPLTPENYSSLWWDEYDVEPIGTVRFSYDNDSEALDYQFGSGRSLYDMSDNDLLNGTVYPTTDLIKSTLDSNFVPYVDGVEFVPIDLKAKGLPYLEAGDAIIITAEDGTLVNSIIMRQEISGIQVLTAAIESTGGTIIKSEVT